MYKLLSLSLPHTHMYVTVDYFLTISYNILLHDVHLGTSEIKYLSIHLSIYIEGVEKRQVIWPLVRLKNRLNNETLR